MLIVSDSDDSEPEKPPLNRLRRMEDFKTPHQQQVDLSKESKGDSIAPQRKRRKCRDKQKEAHWFFLDKQHGSEDDVVDTSDDIYEPSETYSTSEESDTETEVDILTGSRSSRRLQNLKPDYGLPASQCSKETPPMPRKHIKITNYFQSSDSSDDYEEQEEPKYRKKSTISPSTPVSFGMHKGKTFKHLPDNHPNYAECIRRTDKKGHNYKLLKEWLESNYDESDYASDDSFIARDSDTDLNTSRKRRFHVLKNLSGHQVFDMGRYKGVSFTEVYNKYSGYVSWAMSQSGADGCLSDFQKYVQSKQTENSDGGDSS